MRWSGFRANDDMRRAVAGGMAAAEAVAEHARPGAGERERAAQVGDLRGAESGTGPALAGLLADGRVTDVLVNAGRVWVDRGNGLEVSRVELGDEDTVRALAVRMAAACGRRLDHAEPIVDGTLPGGTRLHAVLPPVSACGTVISLRTARPRAFTLDELVDAGTVHAAIEPVLRALVSRRANGLVVGATGSGKTTLLAAMLGLVPADERILCIEEVGELRPAHPHVVTLQERRANVQGEGRVDLSALVRAAMRMRPDRLVLGECRGPEVRDVLTALNTGHDGGWATLHANSVGGVPARLEALGSLADMGTEAVRAQVTAAFDAVVHILRGRESRYVDAIGVFAVESGVLACRKAVQVSEGGRVEYLAAWGGLCRRLGVEPDTLR